jgi:predicted permease
MRALSLAIRTLFRTPFVTTVAILSLALGMGANAAVFSLVQQVLVRPLPVRNPERLVNLSASVPNPGWKECNVAGPCEVVFSYPMFRDLEHVREGFVGIAAHRGFDANLAYRGQTLHGEGMLVSGSYFGLLGVRPALGRLLGPADDETIGGHPVAVLSHEYWESQFGADPDVLDRTVNVNGRPLTIVGVAPQGFEGTTLGIRPRVFVPIAMAGAILPQHAHSFDSRLDYWLYLFGRLEPGVSRQQAGNAINRVYSVILDNVEASLQEPMSEQEMAMFRAKRIGLEPGARGQSKLVGETARPLLVLFGVTGVLFLIACANISNLLLVRGAKRRMEMAIRLSLGATRGLILRQLLTESCVLAALGGAASLVVATWTLAAIARLLPPESAALLNLGLRWPVVLFAVALAVGTSVLAGLFPALHNTRPDLATTIRANAGQVVGARSAARFRTSLVTAQIALSLLLLVSAGLFLRSLRNISQIELGMRVDHVIEFTISPGLSGYDPTRRQALFERVEEEFTRRPGVNAVSSSVVPVLTGVSSGTAVAVEGPRLGTRVEGEVRTDKVGPDYFRALGIPLLAGREFTPSDGLDAPRVAVVNEAFARKFALGRDAVGKRMRIGSDGALDIEIVGIVEDARYFEVKGEQPPLFVTPYRQDEGIGAMTFYVRSAGDLQQVLRTVPGVVAGLDPNLPVQDVKTLPEQVRETVYVDRIVSTLTTAFAVLATVLAAIGLYGVLAYTVSQRTREIGLRLALGADGRRIHTMVLRQVLRTLLIGSVLGITAALALGRLLDSLLFGLRSDDPVVAVLAAAFLAFVALTAGYLPARRASRIDPMEALRYE